MARQIGIKHAYFSIVQNYNVKIVEELGKTMRHTKETDEKLTLGKTYQLPSYCCLKKTTKKINIFFGYSDGWKSQRPIYIKISCPRNVFGFVNRSRAYFYDIQTGNALSPDGTSKRVKTSVHSGSTSERPKK